MSVKEHIVRTRLVAVLTMICALLAAGCQAPPADPLREVSRGLERYPRYSIILSDMDVSGTFFKTYKHRYKVLFGKAGNEGTGGAETVAEEGLTFDRRELQWTEVDRKFYQQHEPHLGMVLLSKGEDGKVEEAAYPPGYQYVGNSRYGTWRTDRRGNSFWEFYGKYALFSHLMGSSRPIYRNDYDSYRDYRRRRQPYFGGNAYGTRGTVTRTSNPTFYQRQQARQQTKNQRFSQRAKSRTSSARSRSSGRGK